MAITSDNSIIDFNTINNLVTTLQSQQDIFTTFTQNPLVAFNNQIAAEQLTASFTVGNIQFAAMKVVANVNNSNTAAWAGVTFTAPPVVVATSFINRSEEHTSELQSH